MRLDGSAMSVSYASKDGMHIDETLTMVDNGSKVANHMVVRKFGMTVAVLDESITKVTD